MFSLRSEKSFKNMKTLKEYKLECELAPARCLFFYRSGSTQCAAMQKILHDICAKNGFKLIELEMSNMEFFPVVSKYNIRCIPGCVFIENDSIIFQTEGMENKRTITKKLKRV